MRKLAVCLAVLLLVPLAAQAQRAEAPDSPGPGTYEGGEGPPGVGTFIASVPVAFSTGVVGLENDGSGNLRYTDNTLDEIGSMTTAGAQVGGSTFTVPTTVNPIGVTDDGVNIYVTDAANATVEVFTLAGAPVNSIDVSAQSTFPEGITYSPLTNTFFLVDGTATNFIIEYDTNFAVVSTATVVTTSNDGIAYDPARCSLWYYASGQDQVTQLSVFDQSVITSFAGTNAQPGLGTGEGLGVIGDTVFVMAAGSDNLASFDISGAQSVCPEPADVSGTKSVDGAFEPGGMVTYTIVLTNNGTGDQGDNAGDEFTDTLDANLTVTSAAADSGTAAFVGNTVTWNGTIMAGASVTITVEATINAGVAGGTSIDNVGTINFDGTGDGTNESSAQTNGGAVVSFQVGSILDIPTLDGIGLALLIVALMALSLRQLLRRRQV